MKKLMLIICVLLILPTTIATNVGVNYYHESLMTSSGEKYIPRTAEQARSDLQHIKGVSDYVKLYANPFVPQNIDWVETLVDIGHEEDLHMSVSMMVDDRQLTNENWEEYHDRVVAICSRFNGMADEMVIGNEITLHSPMSRTEIRDKVLILIEDCETVYDGEALYQEFWWAKDVWAGYNEPIYLMMYENWNTFESNMHEFENFFGQNGLIGEWGEDLKEDPVVHNENWQRMEIERRWNLIESKNVPIAYIFAYREPSFTGFGLVDLDGREKPAWDFIASLGQGGNSGSDSGDSGSGGDTGGSGDSSGTGLLADLSTSCDVPGCSVTADIDMGSCRSVEFSSNNGPIKILACYKGGGFAELYRQTSPAGSFEVCLGAGCVDEFRGFDRFEMSASSGDSGGDSSGDTGGDSGEDGGSDSGDTWSGIANAQVSCTDDCTKQTDTVSGVCRTITWSTPNGPVKIQACDKGGFVEVYRQQGTNDFSACVAGACVDQWYGYKKATY